VRTIEHFQAWHRVSKGEVVVDAGAFYGAMTVILAAQTGPAGRVISFEPDAVSHERVLRNLGLNGSPAHVEVIPEGLWDKRTQIEFWERGALGSSAFWDGPGARKVIIQTTTLDEVVAQRRLSRLDFVKMNIEGAEIKALLGASATIHRLQPHFAISSDHFLDGNIAAGERTSGTLENILREHGYRTETVRYGTEWVTYGAPEGK
jgi:FkbM family methyltransferase